MMAKGCATLSIIAALVACMSSSVSADMIAGSPDFVDIEFPVFDGGWAIGTSGNPSVYEYSHEIGGPFTIQLITKPMYPRAFLSSSVFLFGLGGKNKEQKR